MSTPESKTVTVQRAWMHVMTTMGGTNLQRSRDARKVTNALKTIRRTR